MLAGLHDMAYTADPVVISPTILWLFTIKCKNNEVNIPLFCSSIFH